MEDNINFNHKIIIDERKRLEISGIKEVKSFDDETIVLVSVMGKITVKGENLHIKSFDTESGDIFVDGKIHAVVYMSEAQKGTFMSRIFR